MNIKELVQKHFCVRILSMTNGSQVPVVRRADNPQQSFRRGDKDSQFEGYQAYLFNNSGIIELDSGNKFLVDAEERNVNDLGAHFYRAEATGKLVVSVA